MESNFMNFNIIDNPIDIYISWGTCINYAKILWDENTINSSNPLKFKSYIECMDKTIGFHCVIMARFSWGLLLIDMCDSSDWELDHINEPHIYLKMQYNTKYRYQNNVKPFTYLVSNPINFESNLATYRQQYINTYKTNLAYGRWIAVSLSRYNIAKKMRDIGILVGGEYCLTPKGKGYDDHEKIGILDYIKPRERMKWDEYFKYQCTALCTIDAKGFGDMTHRIIESFAIGIPVIRPKLSNITYNNIEVNKHYLDCGENGEYLIECLDKIKDDNIRHDLINNSLEWYEKNASSNGFKSIINEIIRKNI